MAVQTESLHVDDFDSLDWQSVPDRATKRDCWAYSRVYRQLAADREAAGDLRRRDACALLWKCTELRLVPENPDEPFDAVLQLRTSRSSILDDISGEEIEVLRHIASTATDAELKARLADICWTTKRDYELALVAIDSYLDAASLLDKKGDWLDAKDRVERALRLAAQLGRGNAGRFSRVVEFIESQLSNHDQSIEERRFQPAHLMSLLIEFGKGDSDRSAVLAETLAVQAEQQRGWERAQTYWQRRSEWDELRKDDSAKKAALVKAAELYVNIANDFLLRSEPDHLSASIQLARAFEALRRLGETEKANRIHHDLLRHQELSSAQLKSFSQEMDISKFVEQAMEAVRGKSLGDAILIFVRLFQPSPVSELRETASRYASDFLFRSLFTSQRVDSRGRVVATKPSSAGIGPVSEEALQADMFEHASQLQGIAADATIQPARYQINLEHRVRFEHLLPLLINNPLVPPGREHIVARGLHAGFTGDFLVACHLLIPQFEHSIRYVLEERGVLTTWMSSEGIQEDMDLGKLLRHELLLQLFGEDFVFSVRGLLVERFGSNLRNLSAHGLLSHGHFYSGQAIYFWWFMLRYYCLPILMNMRLQQVDGNPTDAPAGEATGEK